MVTDLLDWDGMGKLRTIRGVYEALYDAGGSRVSATRGGTTHTYSFGAGLLRDSTSGGARVHTPGISQGDATGEEYFHEDWLGSVRYTTPELGSLASATSKSYDAYGYQGHHPSQETVQFAGLHGYQSDVPNGLQLLGARYYDPYVGRFLNPDAIGFELDRNTPLPANNGRPQ